MSAESSSSSSSSATNVLNLNRTNLESTDPILAEIQGNILKSHGRNFVSFIFIHFQSRTSDWLAGVPITSAAEQEKQTAGHKATPPQKHLFYNVFISSAGYAALGATAPVDDSFTLGAKKQAEVNHDPPVQDWVAPYKQDDGQEIHAVILVADDEKQRVEDEVDRLIEVFRQRQMTVLGIQKAFTLRRRRLDPYAPAPDQVVEHFGFADGVSQPLFMKSQLSAVKNKSEWDPAADLSLVLTSDPAGGFGSYAVIRKLAQDVNGFNAAVQQLNQALGHSDIKLTEAMVVGRFKTGTPVVLSNVETPAEKPETTTTNFNYSIDSTGPTRCPFQSHIRKTNPRGDTVRIKHSTDEKERSRRITRRGVSFEDENGEVGLFFICVQSSIQNQFEFIQQSWANNTAFAQDGTGLDTLIGQPSPGAQPVPQQWPKVWGTPGNDASFNFAGFIRMRGGEYFFLPSIKFVQSQQGKQVKTCAASEVKTQK